jgi:AhpD family alkylhydroperoxidase
MTRMELEKVAPQAAQAVYGLEQYVRGALDKTVQELVKLRASYVNSCAFCIDMHAKDAVAAGETTERLFAVAAWEDSELFSEKERAALALTDAITRIGEHGVGDDVWAALEKNWDEKEIADLIVAATTINVWNRLNIATRRTPGT